MSGASSTRTIIESFARPSPLIRESVSIASSPAKSNFVNRGDPPRSIPISIPTYPLPLPFSTLAVGDNPELLTAAYCFRITDGLLQELGSVHERNLEEEGGGRKKRGRARSSEQPKRVRSRSIGGWERSEGGKCAPPLAVEENRPKSIEIHAIVRARGGGGEEGERGRGRDSSSCDCRAILVGGNGRDV